HQVRFLVVGGEAVIHHGYTRFTADVDFFYQPQKQNVQRLYAALADFWGEPVPVVEGPEDLLVEDSIIQYGCPPNRIDLINTLGTVDFDEAWERRIEETLTDAGVTVPYPIIGLDDLLKSKRDAGRLKDLLDIQQLTSPD
ncbi:MAG: hypothetical protein HN348_20840, partial [Proteobacteria bacterium]|nr:hypothetical protein [Pseudomonadota bacterium]